MRQHIRKVLFSSFTLAALFAVSFVSPRGNIVSWSSVDIRVEVFPGTAKFADVSLSAISGLLDEVAIYNRALSAEEIQAIYNAGSAGKCKHL